MPLVALAFFIGVIAGLRSLTAPAVVSWAASSGWLHLEHTPIAFLGKDITAGLLTALAIGELIGDKLPKTPSRKALVPFIARILTGALSGAALGASRDSLPLGLIAGAVGAVAGTLGGYEARKRLASAFGRDLPAALLEDVVAVGGAIWICWQIS